MKSQLAFFVLAFSLSVNAQEAPAAPDKSAGGSSANSTANDNSRATLGADANEKDTACDAMRARAAELDSQGQLNLSQAAEYFQLRLDLTKCKPTQVPPENSLKPQPVHGSA